MKIETCIHGNVLNTIEGKKCISCESSGSTWWKQE